MNTEIQNLIAARNLDALAALTGGDVCPQGGLTIPGFGRVSWDAQDPQNEGWVVESLDYNGGLDGQPEPYDADELASALAEVADMASRVPSLGQDIKSRRLALDLTQGELGEKTGFTQAQISHWESGYRTPSVEQLEALAKVLGSFVIG